MKKKMSPLLARIGFNLYPPFLGAGIRIKKISPQINDILIELKRHFWNRNYVNTHYGGSLYSMCDPFYMLILMNNIGRGYIVWDKEATIRFKKAVKDPVYAYFSISEEKLNEIRSRVDKEGKIEFVLTVEVKTKDGTIIAEVDKLLYVKKK